MSPGQQNGWLLRVRHTLCVTDKVNRHLSKKMKKMKKNEKKKSKLAKSLRYMDEFFPRLIMTYHYSLLENKASKCYKIEAVIQMCSVKKVFLKIHRKTPVLESLF